MNLQAEARRSSWPIKARLITDDAKRRKLFPLIVESCNNDQLTIEHIDECIALTVTVAALEIVGLAD